MCPGSVHLAHIPAQSPRRARSEADAAMEYLKAASSCFLVVLVGQALVFLHVSKGRLAKTGEKPEPAPPAVKAPARECTNMAQVRSSSRCFGLQWRGVLVSLGCLQVACAPW